MPRAPEVLAVFGPTASGKSEVAEDLADRLDTEVVSTDAMQVYRGLPILTNQPARPTRLVAFRELSDEMSVGDYERVALAETGESLAPDRDRLWGSQTRRPTLVAGLDVPKEVLEQRIVERTDEMFRRGVVDEVRAALANGDISSTAERALGLREIAELEPASAREAIVRRTIRDAAYPRKWMRRIPGIGIIDADPP